MAIADESVLVIPSSRGKSVPHVQAGPLAFDQAMDAAQSLANARAAEVVLLVRLFGAWTVLGNFRPQRRAKTEGQ